MAGGISKKLNVIVSASTSAFKSGMAQAIAPLNQFRSGVSSLGSSLTSFKGMIAAAGAAAAVAGFTSLVKGQMEAIDSTAKLSDRLGISTEALVGLQHAADLSGVSSEQLTGAFEKLNKSVAEAAMSGGPAEAAFARIGLSAQQLINQSPDQTFTQIADGLAGIQNPAERAAVAMQIFGKSGQQLLPLMLSGSEGIKAAQAEAEKLGLTFSRVDAAKVEAANDALTKAKAVFTGMARTLAVELAPFVTALADRFTGVATSGEGMGKKVINAFEWVLTAVAKAADWLELLKAGFHSIRGVAALALSGLVQGLGYVIQAVEWLAQKLGAAESNIGKFTVAVGEEMVTEAATAFQNAGESFDRFANGSNSKAVTETFKQIRADADAAAQKIADSAAGLNGAAASTDDWAEAFERTRKNAEDVAKTLEDLRLKREQAGMSEQEKQLDDLKRKGASPEQLAQAQADIAATDSVKKAKERTKQLEDAAKSVFESTRTPLEKYEQRIGELHELLNAGMIDWETYGRAVRDANKELNSEAKTTADVKAPDLHTKGSAAAQKMLYQVSAGYLHTKGSKEIELAQSANRILERIEGNTRADGKAEQKPTGLMGAFGAAWDAAKSAISGMLTQPKKPEARLSSTAAKAAYDSSRGSQTLKGSKLEQLAATRNQYLAVIAKNTATAKGDYDVIDIV